MLLSTYLKKHNQSVAGFADLVGCGRHTIYRLMDGTRKPSLKMLSAIEHFTGGDVVLKDFLPVKNGKVKGRVLTDG